MSTKKRIAGFLFLLAFTGTVLNIPVRIQAAAPRQMQADFYTHGHSGQEKGLPGVMQTEFLESSAQLPGTAVKSIQPDSYLNNSYNLSESVWACFGGSYYYSLLDTREKILYLDLKQAANAYLTGMDDFQTTKVIRGGEEVQIYVLPMVSYQGLSTEQMKKVFYCFLFENPQYYFLRNSVIYSEKSEAMTIGLYEIFANGSERGVYTAEFANRLYLWRRQIEMAETAVDKERLIHQIVCEYAAYNNSMAEAENDPDDKMMSQSCISAVLFERSTLCTGFAQLFSLLCNSVDIACVTVTSAGHAWNKVYMGGSWYNVDCTWDDIRGDEAFLNVTDEQLQAEDTKSAEHTLSKEWEEIAPSCTNVFDSEAANKSAAGAGVPVPGDMNEITLKSREKGKISVEFHPVAGYDGYTVQYALDNSMDAFKKKETEAGFCVLTGLKSGKTYYVRVQGYTLDSCGNKLSGTYSKKQEITVK